MQDFAEQHRLIFDELLEDGGRQKQFELINQGAYIRQGSLGFDITPEGRLDIKESVISHKLLHRGSSFYPSEDRDRDSELIGAYFQTDRNTLERGVIPYHLNMASENYFTDIAQREVHIQISKGWDRQRLK